MATLMIQRPSFGRAFLATSLGVAWDLGFRESLGRRRQDALCRVSPRPQGHHHQQRITTQRMYTENTRRIHADLGSCARIAPWHGGFGGCLPWSTPLERAATAASCPRRKKLTGESSGKKKRHLRCISRFKLVLRPSCWQVKSSVQGSRSKECLSNRLLDRAAR